MAWYAAHVVLYFELREERQEEFSVLENVYLVRAANSDEALSRAKELGQAECVEDASLTVNDKPARLVYGGVRKLVSCAADPEAPGASEVEVIEDGVEATYSFWVVQSRETLDALIRGESVSVLLEE